MSGMSSLSICGFIGDVCSAETPGIPLKMINTKEQVTEVITEVAEQIGFSVVKAKQREAILAFLSGYGKFLIFALLPRVNRIKGVRQIQQNSSTFSIQETCCYV